MIKPMRRSAIPFCCGEAGSMNDWTMPSARQNSARAGRPSLVDPVAGPTVSFRCCPVYRAPRARAVFLPTARSWRTAFFLPAARSGRAAVFCPSRRPGGRATPCPAHRAPRGARRCPARRAPRGVRRFRHSSRRPRGTRVTPPVARRGALGGPRVAPLPSPVVAPSGARALPPSVARRGALEGLRTAPPPPVASCGALGGPRAPPPSCSPRAAPRRLLSSCTCGVAGMGWRVCEPPPPPPPPSPTAAAAAEGGGCVGAEGVVLGGCRWSEARGAAGGVNGSFGTVGGGWAEVAVVSPAVPVVRRLQSPVA
ncbi:unnamed protein product [Closterium sp. NIES-53]